MKNIETPKDDHFIVTNESVAQLIKKLESGATFKFDEFKEIEKKINFAVTTLKPILSREPEYKPFYDLCKKASALLKNYSSVVISRQRKVKDDINNLLAS